MTFFRREAGKFNFILVKDFVDILEREFPLANRGNYRLYPNSLGNIAISSPKIEGPQGPGCYYLGYIDIALGKVVWFGKEAPGARENTFTHHGGIIENAQSAEANGPIGSPRVVCDNSQE